MILSPRFPKGFDAQIGTKIISKWNFTTTLILMTMVRMMVGSMRKMEEYFEKAPANLGNYFGARIPNTPGSLEGGDFGLKFQTQNA